MSSYRRPNLHPKFPPKIYIFTSPVDAQDPDPAIRLSPGVSVATPAAVLKRMLGLQQA